MPAPGFSIRLGRYLIAGGGIGIIAAVLGIFVFVVRETYPLFGGAEVRPTGSITLAEGPPLAVGVDPYREIAFAVVPSGLEFRGLPSGETVRRVAPGDWARRSSPRPATAASSSP